MADEASPQLLRQELGLRLRELRQSRDLTVEGVAAELMCSASKVSRMETGQRGASQRDVRDLCDLYGVEDAEAREELMALAKGTRQRRGVWQLGEGGGDPDYASLESTATAITVFVSSILPALFQTEEYARAHLRGRYPDLDDDWIDQRIQAFAIRQRALTRVDPPRVTALIDEAALHRRVGDDQTMDRQLDRLLRVIDLPNVEVRVVPFSVGSHPGVESGFSFLEFSGSRVSAVAYFEGLGAGQSGVRRREDIDRYRRAIRRITSIALDNDQTARFLADIRDRRVG